MSAGVIDALILPWPPAACSPNARGHWSKKSKAAKTYRAKCYLMARLAHLQIPAGKILLSLEFMPPDKRRRDDDNLIAMFKPGRDGLADALGIDDCKFVTQVQISEETASGGAVRVRLAEYAVTPQ